jgi:hypothetical protein
MENYETVYDLDNDSAAAPESGQSEGAAETGHDETVAPESGQAETVVGFRKRSKDEIAAAPKRVRVQNDADDIQCVLEMRQSGLSYMKIEAKLGWPNSHGNRAWRICRDYALVTGETVQ